jgi:glyoxylate/hydroxypyruvate reductase A
VTRILFYLEEYPHESWRDALLNRDPSIDFKGYPDWGSAEDGPAYAVVWEPKHGLIKDYTNIKAIFSLGAGIDHILADTSIPEDIPIIRMGDDGLKEGMAEFVLMNVLMHHRQIPEMISAQQDRNWLRLFSKPASAVTVGIMGYGALGHYAAQALKPLGYKIRAWSTSPKAAEAGVQHFAGNNALAEFLSGTDILVGLLPDTPATSGLLNEDTLACLPKGAAVVNAGRGSLIDIDALLHHLDTDHLSGATLDVVPEEPLPQNSALWHHKKVIITPHIAAITRTDTAANYIVDNIKLLQNGDIPTNMLNRNRGY